MSLLFGQLYLSIGSNVFIIEKLSHCLSSGAHRIITLGLHAPIAPCSFTVHRNVQIFQAWSGMWPLELRLKIISLVIFLDSPWDSCSSPQIRKHAPSESLKGSPPKASPVFYVFPLQEETVTSLDPGWRAAGSSGLSFFWPWVLSSDVAFRLPGFPTATIGGIW